jgi:hypothetical protein
LRFSYTLLPLSSSPVRPLLLRLIEFILEQNPTKKSRGRHNFFWNRRDSNEQSLSWPIRNVVIEYPLKVLMIFLI